jgi:hypothetical protein
MNMNGQSVVEPLFSVFQDDLRNEAHQDDEPNQGHERGKRILVPWMANQKFRVFGIAAVIPNGLPASWGLEPDEILPQQKTIHNRSADRRLIHELCHEEALQRVTSAVAGSLDRQSHAIRAGGGPYCDLHWHLISWLDVHRDLGVDLEQAGHFAWGGAGILHCGRLASDGY